MSELGGRSVEPHLSACQTFVLYNPQLTVELCCDSMSSGASFYKTPLITQPGGYYKSFLLSLRCLYINVKNLAQAHTEFPWGC